MCLRLKWCMLVVVFLSLGFVTKAKRLTSFPSRGSLATELSSENLNAEARDQTKFTLTTRRLQQSGNDGCPPIGCSRHGTVLNVSNGVQECDCEDGYTGLDCQLNNESCSGGQLDIFGRCCKSGIFNLTGYCCERPEDEESRSSWRLDDKGECCDRPLDACGVCGGTGFLDAKEQCCQGQLDSSGECCGNGRELDECGICDGFGESCKQRINITVSNSTRTTVSCLEDFLRPIMSDPQERMVTVTRLGAAGGRQYVASVDGTGRSSAAVVDTIDSVIPVPENNTCQISSVSLLNREPVCGNDKCETGESLGPASDYSCPEDCPHNITECKILNTSSAVGQQGEICSGNGVCLFTKGGTCRCMEGYNGSLCDQCSDGFTIFNKFCVPRQRMPENQTFICSSTDSSDDDDVNLGLVLGLTFGALFLALFVMVLLAFFCSFRRTRPSQIKAVPRDLPSGSSPAASPSGTSLLRNYKQRWVEFQMNPPWAGSFREEKGRKIFRS